MTSPRTYILGIIIFTMLIMSGLFMIDELRAQDTSVIDMTEYAQFNDTFNTMSNVQSEVGKLQTNIESSESNYGTFGNVFGVMNSLMATAWQSLKLLFGSLGFFNDVLFGLTMFGVPFFVPLLVTLAITVMIAFAIFGAIFQRDL